MDETRLRAVIREEIRLAVKTLAEQTYCSDPGSDDYTFEQAASHFGSWAYAGACEAADEQREANAANPFEEAETLARNPAVRAVVRAEVLNVLREMRTAFYASGSADDYRIAERLDSLVTAREQVADE